MNLTKTHFVREATHHALVTKCHRAIASGAEKCMSKAAKSDLKNLDLEGLDEFLQVFIETHNALGDEHAEMAEHCAKCAKAADEAEKAAADDLNKIVPHRVSAVAPTAPGITMVPRFGSPPLQKAAVDSQFSKLLELDERDSEAS